MTWWRDLGKGFGSPGPFSSVQMECAYCGAEGAFARVFEQTRQLQRWNVLRYEVYKCNQCSNITFIIWGGDVTGGPGHWRGLHDFRQFPAPTRLRAPDHWPEQVGNAYIQAVKALESESWDAASTMARRAVQAIIRLLLGTSKGKLRDEIKECVSQHLLPKPIGEWTDEVRELGNIGAHPDEQAKAVSPEDAKDVVRFTREFIAYAIDLPHELKEYRKKRKPA